MQDAERPRIYTNVDLIEHPANTQVLDDDAIERISQRVAELLFHKFLRRVAKAAAIPETVPLVACGANRPRIKPSAAAIERELARRARKGVI